MFDGMCMVSLIGLAARPPLLVTCVFRMFSMLYACVCVDVFDATCMVFLIWPADGLSGVAILVAFLKLCAWFFH